MKILAPPDWPRPTGYSNGISASGRVIVTAGIIGWDRDEYLVADNMAGQFAQALRNVVEILYADGASPKHLIRMTCYVTSIDAYLASTAAIGVAWREIIGAHYPAMAMVEVVRLIEPNALVEIEATAIVPE